MTRPSVSLGCLCPPQRPHPIAAPGGDKQSGKWPVAPCRWKADAPGPKETSGGVRVRSRRSRNYKRDDVPENALIAPPRTYAVVRGASDEPADE